MCASSSAWNHVQISKRKRSNEKMKEYDYHYCVCGAFNSVPQLCCAVSFLGWIRIGWMENWFNFVRFKLWFGLMLIDFQVCGYAFEITNNRICDQVQIIWTSFNSKSLMISHTKCTFSMIAPENMYTWCSNAIHNLPISYMYMKYIYMISW